MFYVAFNIISVESRRQTTHSCISWVLPVLGQASELSCPRTLGLADQVMLESGNSSIRVPHFITKPCRVPNVQTRKHTQKPKKFKQDQIEGRCRQNIKCCLNDDFCLR